MVGMLRSVADYLLLLIEMLKKNLVQAHLYRFSLLILKNLNRYSKRERFIFILRYYL